MRRDFCHLISQEGFYGLSWNFLWISIYQYVLCIKKLSASTIESLLFYGLHYWRKKSLFWSTLTVHISRLENDRGLKLFLQAHLDEIALPKKFQLDWEKRSSVVLYVKSAWPAKTRFSSWNKNQLRIPRNGFEINSYF
jgi:hypothetical protein